MEWFERRDTPKTNMGSELRWLERAPDKREVGGSSPLEPTRLPKEVTSSLFTLHFSLSERNGEADMFIENRIKY